MAVPAPLPSTTSDRAAARDTRLQSLDVLRGLDVLLMLFVNEMAGVRQTPAWLRHVPSGVDGMTITDVVFPAFLFIAGMAIPLALGRRVARGESRVSVWRHVVVRTAALLVMGVFMVNVEEGSAQGFPIHVWNLVASLGLLMLWHVPARAPRTPVDRAVAIAGLLLLAGAALTYRSESAGGLVQMRPHWWGILGLIGWAYFVGASLYLLLGDRVVRLVAACAGLYTLYFLDQFGMTPWLSAFDGIVDVGSVIGSLGALLTSGAALTVLVGSPRVADSSRVRGAVLFSAGMLAAGFGVHAFHEYGRAFFFNKPMATPAWCLVSAGLTAGAWAAAYYLVDVRGWTRWPRVVSIAGEHPLLVYLMAPVVASFLIVALPAVDALYAQLGEHLGTGIARSVAMAWLIVRLSGWLRDRGLRLRV